MGMDVYGKNPTAEAGTYFRNNVWCWRPLADYVLAVAPEEITRRCAYWHSNDGAGLGARDSAKLAAFLQGELDSGRTASYEAAYNARIDALPDHACEYCAGTGIRKDAPEFATRWSAECECPVHGKEWRQLEAEPGATVPCSIITDWTDLNNLTQCGQPTVVLRKHVGSCNACRGKGSLPHDEAAYGFSTENVAGFVTFLRHCGGFEIC